MFSDDWLCFANIWLCFLVTGCVSGDVVVFSDDWLCFVST